MSHSEKNEPTLPIRSPELKSEMAANIGPIADNLAQRISGCGQAGGGRGTGVEPSPRSPAYSNELWRAWYLARARAKAALGRRAHWQGLHNPFWVKRRAETPVRPPQPPIQFGRSSNWGRHDGECRSGRSIATSLFFLASSAVFSDDMSGHADIIDGDTQEIHGTRTRLWGIDAPESSQLRRGGR